MKKFLATESLPDTIRGIIASVNDFYPELFLLLLITLLIIGDLFNFRGKKYFFITTSIIGLGITFVLLIFQWTGLQNGPEALFINMLQLDQMGVYFKMVFCLAGILSIFLTVSPVDKNESYQSTGAYYIIFLSLLTGSFLLAMSANLLMIYISMELVSLSSYLLTSFRFDKASTEASLKYLLYGAVASGVMLYGMSLLYGFSGTLSFGPEFVNNLAVIHWLPLTIASLMVAGGFLFKISAAPFHIWAPDVYTGAPIPVMAFFSVVPKLAGLVVLGRFVGQLMVFDFIHFDWQVFLAVIAILTMLIGNFSALWQKNAKRLMAYSSIAHGGFLMIGLITFSPFGLQTFLFYGSIYLLLNFSVFFALSILGKKAGSLLIDDFKGLGKEFPYLGVIMLIAMIALTGLPPTAGFTAKLFIFSALWENYQQNDQLILFYLLIFGLFNTVVSLFYYIRIPYLMFFKEPGIPLVEKNLHLFEKIIASFLIFLTLILFFNPDWLLNLINSITFAL